MIFIPSFISALRKTFAVSALAAALPLSTFAVEPTLTKVDPPVVLFEKGVGGYFIYKVPVLVSTAQNKNILAIVEAREGSAADDAPTALVSRRSSDDGKTWSQPALIHTVKGRTVGNSAPVLDEATGTLWMFFCIQNREVWVTSTNNAGDTWSKPTNLTSTLRLPRHNGFYATGPGHGIQLKRGAHRGRLLVTAYASQSASPPYKSGSKSFAIFSDDHGKSWVLGEPTEAATEPGPDGNECMATELSDGRLYLTIRNNITFGARAYAFSVDGGHKWSPLRVDPSLPEPVCEASVIAYPLPDGRRAQLYVGPSVAAKGRKDKSARRDLAVWLSADDCKTWQKAGTIHSGPSAYSDQVLLRDANIGLVYEAGQSRYDEKILFVRYHVNPLFAGIVPR